MQKVSVHALSDSYDILLHSGLLLNTSEYLSPYKKAIVVSDTNVYPLYGQYFAGLPYVLLEAGEESKNHETLLHIYDVLAQNNLSRDDALIALGGGVVGDVTGFAAATFKRGMNLIQVPTTLLAQVDSSVGGKVGVNLSAGKNLVGSFYQPTVVLADTDTLKTLDARQYAAGMAEVIKYAFIADDKMFDQLKTKNAGISEIIQTCCTIKARYVHEDPFDRGVRMQLNFGHTFAHAIETVTEYKQYLHGEAVAIGMVLAARVGERLKVSQQGLEAAVRDLLNLYTLPADVEAGVLKEAAKILLQDKKASAGRIHFILIDRIGHAVVQDLSKEELGDLMHG
jgi:3-dehydroquinate synthase